MGRFGSMGFLSQPISSHVLGVRELGASRHSSGGLVGGAAVPVGMAVRNLRGWRLGGRHGLRIPAALLGICYRPSEGAGA